MPYNFALMVITQRIFVEDFLQTKCNFTRKTALLRFESFFGGLCATYDVHLKLIRKLVVDFLLVITELFHLAPFSLGVTAETLRANID